jgi:NAD(P)-dependent dehydrogenase (short-subunit alcohol dehydrogenase family)
MAGAAGAYAAADEGAGAGGGAGPTVAGRRVVVAGGTSGIGEATARAFVARGAEVLVTGRDGGRLEASIARSGARGVVADASTAEGRAALLERAGERVDHLVLALSGASGAGPFADLDLGALRTAFEGKLWPQLEVLQALLPRLAQDGSVVLVTAASARAALPGTVGLAAINGALEAAVAPLSAELAPRRVNAVSPGVIDTPWWDNQPAAAKEAAHAAAAQATPVGAVGSAADVAEAIVLAATNPYITGAVLPVDGGYTLPRG